MQEQLYRRAEVQAILKIGKTKFYALVKNGKLETKKLGRVTVITSTSLKRLIKNLPRTK